MHTVVEKLFRQLPSSAAVFTYGAKHGGGRSNFWTGCSLQRQPEVEDWFTEDIMPDCHGDHFRI